jgi:hypothetical protein
MIHPGLFGNAPALCDTTVVVPGFRVEAIGVLSDGTVRGTHCVLSVAVRPPSVKRVLRLWVRHYGTIPDDEPKNGEWLHAFAFCAQTSPGIRAAPTLVDMRSNAGTATRPGRNQRPTCS